MEFDRDFLKSCLGEAASRSVFVGTSSWKYTGWCGQLYDAQRYMTRGKFATSRFEKTCLTEYAEVFKTVCFDGAYYNFPTEKSLDGLVSQVPADFEFGFKVTDAVTVKKFSKLPRFGPRAGKLNEFYLNPDVFVNGFLTPCEKIRSHVGILIFEFSKFYSSDYEHGKDFVSDLDAFFSKLPTGWPYGVEMRNRFWLKPEYFDCLKRHNVTHVYNSWSDMPAVSEQRAMAGSETSSELSAARFLLKPGRKYEDAVKAFQPYSETKEINEEARQAGALLIKDAKKNPKKKTFIFINNRLEGNALNTIKAMISMAEIVEPEHPPGPS